MGKPQTRAATPQQPPKKRNLKPKPLPKQVLCDSAAARHILGNPSRTTFWRMERDGVVQSVRLRPNGRKMYSIAALEEIAVAGVPQ